MKLFATPDDEVTIFYCKAKLKDGCPVVAYQGRGRNRRVWDATGVDLDCFKASMDLENSRTVAKAAGARCVLIITEGIITIKNAKER